MELISCYSILINQQASILLWRFSTSLVFRSVDELFKTDSLLTLMESTHWTVWIYFLKIFRNSSYFPFDSWSSPTSHPCDLFELYVCMSVKFLVHPNNNSPMSVCVCVPGLLKIWTDFNETLLECSVTSGCDRKFLVLKKY